MKRVRFSLLFVLILSIGINVNAKEQSILRVAVLGTSIKEEVFQNYQKKHPDILFELHPYSTKESLISIPKDMDLLVSTPVIFHKLANSNQLEVLQDDIVAWDDQEPLIKDILSKLGNDKMQGVITEFDTQGILCDRSLFEKANIKIPEERLTWDEFFKLSKQLSSKLKQPAILFQDYYLGEYTTQLLDLYTNSLQLEIWNTKEQKIKIDVEKWKVAWKKILDLVKEKAIDPPNEKLDKAMFPQRKSPMVFLNQSHLGSLNLDTKKYVMIPMPRSSSQSFENVGFEVSSIFSIPKGSIFKEEAEDFLRFLMSEEYEKELKEKYTRSSKKQSNEVIEETYIGLNNREKLILFSPKIEEYVYTKLEASLYEFLNYKKTLAQSMQAWMK